MENVNAIDIKELNKTFASKKGADVVAVSNLDLCIQPGEIFALLGPNGAGKTTTIGTIVGSVIRTSGDVKVFGLDPEVDFMQTRKMIGVVPQELNFDPFVNARKNLEYQSGYMGIPKKEWKIDEIVKKLGLENHMSKNTRALSGGMKRRLLIAKALVHSPQLLILDEPTAGVDVELRHSLWDYVKELNNAGTTIILTTHYLEEAEKLADRIAIIHQGTLQTCGTLEELKKKHDKKNLEEIYLKLTQ